MRCICWTWSAFPSWTVPWRVTSPQFSLWPPTEASLGTVFPNHTAFSQPSASVKVILNNLGVSLVMCYSLISLQNPWNKLSEPSRHPHRSPRSAAHHRHLPLHRKRDEADPEDPVKTRVRHRLSRRFHLLPQMKCKAEVSVSGVRRRMWSWARRLTQSSLVSAWKRHCATRSSWSAPQDWCVVNAR